MSSYRRILAAIVVPLLPAAAIAPVNPGFEDPAGSFPAGWTVGGSVAPVPGLDSPTAAALAPGAAIHQDFAPAAGLDTFSASFAWRIDGSGPLATDTVRARLRGAANGTDLITLRLSPAGLQSFSSGPGWTTDIAFPPQQGVVYTLTVTAGNLDADPEFEYQLTLDDGGTTLTGPIRDGWHNGSNDVATRTSAGTPFETLRFESGSGNTLVVDHVALPGFPATSGQLVANPDFEIPPFPASWTATAGTLSIAGLNGSATAARLPFNTTASIAQPLAASPADFTAEASFQIAGNNTAQGFRWQFLAAGTPLLDLRSGLGGALQVSDGANWIPLLRLSDGAPVAIPANSTVRLRVIGRGFGTPRAGFDLVWSDPGSAALVHAATGLTTFAAPSAAPDAIRFTHDLPAGNSFTVDEVRVHPSLAIAPAATHSLVPPPPPVPDKIVRISGVYPHLAMTNSHDECGVGAVVPWAGKLWAITYGPHLPNGSTDKLYEIAPDLSRVIRPESVGGTPANRFIHTATNQLNIGPHFIDADRNVRTLPPSAAPGRHTATAAHLTDPNRLYLFTMEDGVYDVDARDLSFTTLYPDVQGKGDRFLFGYHGKGAFTGQGRLVVANNGRQNDQGNPGGPAGVLATWDGTTVAANGGAYTADHLANPAADGNAPVTPQPQFIAGWNHVSRTQHCEVSGPGGIYGASSSSDPVWSTGFDAKSVLLHVMENQQWQLWRLPKGSYSHDGSHGWHTEWPRIRQLDPADPSSIYLMHMHGLFYDFPSTFSAANFAGLTPISSYYKMPTDYAVFNGMIVMGKNDASKFSNPLARKNQSNFWFGTLEDIGNWGSPAGHGAVWMNEDLTAAQTSDPFLISGFASRTLHLRNTGGTALTLEIETSTGSAAWTPVRSVTVDAGGYRHEILSDLAAPWVRLRSSAAATGATAFFHLHSPYPHVTPASAGSDEFAALADIRDTRSMSDGIIRVRDHADLSLEFASSRTSATGAAASHRYHLIGGDIALKDVTDATAEAALRSTGATTKSFGSDDASAWIDSGGTRFRLPKLDPLYDAPFAAGWARGVREAVTERELLNCHGTFYEVPRSNSGGYRKMRALATHGKRITDFASWRGLLVLTGVLDDAPVTDTLVRNPDGSAALWLGEIDDLWRMGEPRGTGGPLRNTAVAANVPSDPYLMYGYDRKELTLTTAAAATLTVEVDFLADNTWSVYQTFELGAGETVTHLFPAGFHAHWVRVRSSAATTASATFTYGPAEVRDRFLDWARGQDLPTAAGRHALAAEDHDGDRVPELIEFLVDGSAAAFDPQPLVPGTDHADVLLRELHPEDRIRVGVEFSSGLDLWVEHPQALAPSPDQSGVPAGFQRMRVQYPAGHEKLFFRLRAEPF
jgi:hypothetical protein